MNTTKSIVDVRTPEEYSMGHAAHSINIPLQEIAFRLEEIKSLTQPVILCCASGMRSQQATVFLSQNGINCKNGGPWFDVQ